MKIKIKDLLDYICVEESDIVKNELIGIKSYEDEDKIVQYLLDGQKFSTVASLKECDICDTIAGSINYHTDGKWLWPIWVIHYIKEHNLKLPENFIADIRENNYQYDTELTRKIVEREIPIY